MRCSASCFDLVECNRSYLEVSFDRLLGRRPVLGGDRCVHRLVHAPSEPAFSLIEPVPSPFRLHVQKWIEEIDKHSVMTGFRKCAMELLVECLACLVGHRPWILAASRTARMRPRLLFVLR